MVTAETEWIDRDKKKLAVTYGQYCIALGERGIKIVRVRVRATAMAHGKF